MECIICKDLGSEPLQDNIHCTCKYKYHSSCWIDYVHSKNKISCLLCRKDISINSISTYTIRTPLIAPTAPPYSTSRESGQLITYQEFVNIIQHHNTTNNTAINIQSTSIEQPIQSPKNMLLYKKIIKIIIGITILALIMLLFSLFIK
jgi:hypothetical protein